MAWLATLLFVILSPGLLLTIPAVGKKMFMSGKTSIQSILVHALIFFVILYAIKYYYNYSEGFALTSWRRFYLLDHDVNGVRDTIYDPAKPNQLVFAPDPDFQALDVDSKLLFNTVMMDNLNTKWFPSNTSLRITSYYYGPSSSGLPNCIYITFSIPIQNTSQFTDPNLFGKDTFRFNCYSNSGPQNNSKCSCDFTFFPKLPQQVFGSGIPLNSIAGFYNTQVIYQKVPSDTAMANAKQKFYTMVANVTATPAQQAVLQQIQAQNALLQQQIQAQNALAAADI
jgi:Protein of unknown function (DUF3339)